MADGSAAIRVFFFNPKVLSFFFEKMKVNFFLIYWWIQIILMKIGEVYLLRNVHVFKYDRPKHSWVDRNFKLVIEEDSIVSSDVDVKIA